MNKLLLILMLFPLVGVSAELSLAHVINVPEHFRSGRTTAAFEGSSDIERYVATYEKTFWLVVRKFSENHPRWDKHDLYICNGWASESDACLDAYEGALETINGLIAEYGIEVVRSHAKERLGE